jgi:7,8-dihydropterin-6-yl-methyl-4-(beta-D-ribofuranosyl)aminobenzene 5'-phosphate synthase
VLTLSRKSGPIDQIWAWGEMATDVDRITVDVMSEGYAKMSTIVWVPMVLMSLLIFGCASRNSVLTGTTAALTSTRPASTATPAETTKKLTVTVIYDNNADDERLETAWGFSCLVEGLGKTILFDTGGDGAMLLRNMRNVGINPHDVDVVVISHVHGDHVGGLAAFLKDHHAVTVYLPESFPVGIKDATREAGAELVAVRGPVEICKHVSSTGELGNGIKEQSLVIETVQGLVVITGCAHPGIVNIVRQAKEQTGGKVHLVLGGFHLGGASREAIAGIVEEFQRLGVQRVAPCHCSGDVARMLFEEAYATDFIPAGVGCRLMVGD